MLAIRMPPGPRTRKQAPPLADHAKIKASRGYGNHAKPLLQSRSLDAPLGPNDRHLSTATCVCSDGLTSLQFPNFPISFPSLSVRSLLHPLPGISATLDRHLRWKKIEQVAHRAHDWSGEPREMNILHRCRTLHLGCPSYHFVPKSAVNGSGRFASFSPPRGRLWKIEACYLLWRTSKSE